MLPPKDQHHNESPDGESDYQYAAQQGPIRLGLVEAMLAISGVLVIIGTILAMSGSHKIKIAAVWVFVVAVIIGSVAVGIRLTHEFSKPVAVSKEKSRPYLWVKAIDSYLDKPSFKENGVVIEFIIENASDVPAFNVICDCGLSVSYGELTDAPPTGAYHRSKQPLLFIPARGIQHETLPDPHGFPFDETLIPLIEKSEAFLYVHGTIVYDDSSEAKKKTYACDFCFLYEAKLKSFSIPKFHNHCP